MNKFFESTRLADLIALLAGVLLPLAFAPFHYWILAFVSPALLLACLLPVSAKRCFWRGFLFGLGLFTVGSSWVYISIHIYGNAPVVLAVIITALFILTLSLFYACMAGLFKKSFTQKRLSQCWLAFPALWTLFEWIRTWAFTGFPWLLLGNSQLTSPLAGFAPLVSVYGVSFLTVLIAAILVTLLTQTKWTVRLQSLALISVILLSGWGLQFIDWTQPSGPAIKVSLIQGDIPQEMKWDPQALQQSLDVYRRLTEQHWDSQLIIWPEAAIATFPQEVPNFIAQLNQSALNHDTTILTGIPLYEAGHYYNAMITLGKGRGTYLKRHLVPFGEYLPFKNVLGILLHYLKIPMSNFSSGPRIQRNIDANGLQLSPFICYEIAYPQEVRNALKRANAIVVITDDSWFGKSIAQAQHLQIAQMRALETGRFLLNDTNNGLTAIINPQGHIQQQIPAFTTQVLTANMTPMRGRTPWMMIGIWPLVLGLLVILVIAFWRQKR